MQWIIDLLIAAVCVIMHSVLLFTISGVLIPIVTVLRMTFTSFHPFTLAMVFVGMCVASCYSIHQYIS